MTATADSGGAFVDAGHCRAALLLRQHALEQARAAMNDDDGDEAACDRASAYLSGVQDALNAVFGENGRLAQGASSAPAAVPGSGCRVLTTGQAAKRLSAAYGRPLSLQTARAWVMKGILAGYHDERNGHWYADAAAVEAIEREQAERAQATAKGT